MAAAATAEATSARAARFARCAFRPLGRTGLAVSAIGFGACRLDDERDAHVQALRLALASGVNVVATSGVAFDGGSERAVGRALAAPAEGGARREEIVLVTRAGHVRGRALSREAEREQAGNARAGMVKHDDSSWHCLHPDFLRSQLRRSCRRMGVESLDVVLLDDPEAALHGEGAASPGQLRARLREAFAFLQGECESGRVGWYGVSSGELARPSDAGDGLSLDELVSLAQDAAAALGRDRGAHRLAVVEAPGNVLETGVATSRGGPRGRTTLKAALAEGVGVLLDRPLSATIDGHAVRLADWPERAPGTTLAEAAAEVAAMEDEFERAIAPALEPAPGAPELFRWGRELAANASRIVDALHWRQVETELVRPRLEHALAHVGLHLVGRIRNDWSAWKPAYVAAVERLLGAVADLHRERAQAGAEAARLALPAMTGSWPGRPLSQQALLALLALPGVTCVLPGMRDARWVEDALEVLHAPAPPPWTPSGASAPRI